MSRWLRQGLSLINLRKAVGFGNFFAATKFELGLKLEKPNFKNALVLAPHPDDDAFGMGGTIKKITSSGGKVTVAYFCDGSGGVPEEDTKKLEAKNEGFVTTKEGHELVEQRKLETKEAGKILGVSEMIFWGYKDGKLAAGTAAIRALSDLIKRLQPDIIFLPSFLDNHSDHRVVNEIFINACLADGRAVSNMPNMKTATIWAYEIWTPIYVNRLVDITLYIKTKQEAVQAHQSQLNSRGYDKAIVGLNQYRAEINKISGYAEAFFCAPVDIYIDLYRKS